MDFYQGTVLRVDLSAGTARVEPLNMDRARLYNGLRPHSSLGNRPPAPETIVFPGFSLAGYAPPTSTPEVTLALT